VTVTELPAVDMLAVIVVRDGELPLGANEVAAEAGGAAVLAGTRPEGAVGDLTAVSRVWTVTTPATTPGVLTHAIAPLLERSRILVLPGSPDGRDLAPRLAFALRRPLLAGAVRCTPGEVTVSRWDDRLDVTVAVDGPVVATLRPGVRGEPSSPCPPTVEEVIVDQDGEAVDGRLMAVLEPEPETAELSEAARILGGGAGLVPPGTDGTERMAKLRAVAAALGASTGATRVVTDSGWAEHSRQIGTTGVLVNPELYVAFGVSGAAQHVGGLGRPGHVVSINTDPSCPMTALADLGIVADAPGVLDELASRLLPAEQEGGRDAG
jgi:electron transfer flavoprotein alpha subunit